MTTMTTFPTIPTDNLADAALAVGITKPIKAKAKRSSTSGKRERVFLDKGSKARVAALQAYILREMGQQISLSMCVRLALHNLTGRLAEALGDGDVLAQRIKSASEGR